MASISERRLGRRTVFYLKNESMVGRIPRHKLTALASALGVAGKVRVDLEECRDSDARYRVMGEILDAWCAKEGPRAADTATLSSVMDQARITYQAKAIRDMNEDVGSTISAPVPIERRRDGHLSFKASRRPPPPASANGLLPDLNQVTSSRGATPFYRGSDGGTEEGSDSSSFMGKLPLVDKIDEYQNEEVTPVKRTLSKKKSKSKYTYDGKVNSGKSKKRQDVVVSTKSRKSNASFEAGDESYRFFSSNASSKSGSTMRSLNEAPNDEVFEHINSDNDETGNEIIEEDIFGLADIRKETSAYAKTSTHSSDFDDFNGSSGYHSSTKTRAAPKRLPGVGVSRSKPTKYSFNNNNTISKARHKPPISSRKEESPTKALTRRTKELELADPLDLMLDEDMARSNPDRGRQKPKPKPRPSRSLSPSKKSVREDPPKENGHHTTRSPQRRRLVPDKMRSSSQPSNKKLTTNGYPAESNQDPTSSPKKMAKSKSDNRGLNKRWGSPSKSPKKSPKQVEKAEEEVKESTPTPTSSPRKSPKKKVNARRNDPRSSPTKELPNSPTKRSSSRNSNWEREKRMYYYSKYGTWRELQALSKANLKKAPEVEDTLQDDIDKSLETIDYLDSADKKAYSKALFTKIRSDKYLNSLCMREKEYLNCAVHVFSSFGTDIQLSTRTQLLVWFTLERLRRLWILNEDPVPSADDILSSTDTMDFVRSVTKLCFHVASVEQITVTGYFENDRKRKRVVIVFKNFGVRISKKKLVKLGIVKAKETGNFIEVTFLSSILVDFLGACHGHIGDEEISDLPKAKLLTVLPFLCGLAGATNKFSKLTKEQTSGANHIVTKFVQAMTGLPPSRDPDYYIRMLQNLWLESQQTFLNCVFEARLRDIFIYPPPGDKQIVLALHPLYIHDVIPLAYYLDNIDQERIQIEGLMMQETSLDDQSLKAIGKNVWNVKKVQITGNYFSVKGINDVTKHLRGGEPLRIRSLDLSDSNIDDDALAKLNPLLPYLEELCLSDNFFTWYGIRKIVQPVKKTKKLKRLEMSRCNLNEHAFYELIPMILRTEHVILEGNEFTPLELKIFARQVRDSQNVKLDTLVLNSCKLDDECLSEIGKFVTKVPNIHLQNNVFTLEGLSAVTKKHDMGQMKSINLRGCKLNSDCLVELADLIPKLESITLSNNNFNATEGAKALATAIEDAGDKIKAKFIDLRHCRLIENSKKLLNEACRKSKVDIKMW